MGKKCKIGEWKIENHCLKGPDENEMIKSIQKQAFSKIKSFPPKIKTSISLSWVLLRKHQNAFFTHMPKRLFGATTPKPKLVSGTCLQARQYRTKKPDEGPRTSLEARPNHRIGSDQIERKCWLRKQSDVNQEENVSHWSWPSNPWVRSLILVHPQMDKTRQDFLFIAESWVLARTWVIFH